MERFDRRAHAGRNIFERREEKRSIGRYVCVSHNDDSLLFVFVLLLV